MTVRPTGAAPTTITGTVSVILVNYRGADDTIACLKAFRSQAWPTDRLELIVVDNCSGDGSAATIRAAIPEATIIESPVNSGFAGGCNLGARAASGEFLGFINNDARPDDNWIASAVDTFSTDIRIAAVASKVLDWEGEAIDYVDASMTWFGMGYKREVGRADSPDYDESRDVLFGTGAAMFVRKDIYLEVGGFDERFFMFYEDVDLGWRLNLLGYRVRYEPLSIAYHRHHVSIAKFGEFRESYLLERNALMAMFKNYDDDSLAKTFAPALALAVTRGFSRTDVDTATLDLQRSPHGDDVGSLKLPKASLTGAFAVDYFARNADALTAEREGIQSRRCRSDAEILPLFRQAIEPAYPGSSYVAAHDSLVQAFGVDKLFATRRRILIITGEPLGATMAGPAIRAWEMAKVLAGEHDVHLASTMGASLSHPTFTVSTAASSELRKLVDWSDVVVFQGFFLESLPWLKDSEKIIVADIYDPVHLEQLEQAKDKGEDARQVAVERSTAALNEQLMRGDFFLCASAKQRDFWLGQLAALGRINPLTYDRDESLSSLIGVVPFGIEDKVARGRKPAIRGVIDGIADTDKVILWGGGIYNWFDPLTLIRAVSELATKHDDVRLLFMGVKHPNPGVPAMQMATRARDLAQSLGVMGTSVFFNEGWVPYEDRADFLTEADLGVSTHFDHIETAFSFRTRILDYLWAGLPVVATGGDTFGELIELNGLGATVPPQDVSALAAALESLLYDKETNAATRARVAEFRTSYRWPVVLQPLVEFCRAPYRAADLAQGDEHARPAGRVFVAARRKPSMAENLRLAKDYFAAGGVREVTRRAVGRVRNAARDRRA